MKNATIVNTKIFIQKSWIMITIATCWGLLIAKTIIDGKLLYSGIIVIAPVLVYLFIQKPFIFPFGLYVFSLPFESLLVLTGASRGPTLSKLLAALSMCAILLKGHFQGKLKGPDAINIWWVLFWSYSLLSTVWASSSTGIGRIPTILGLVVLYVVLSSYNIEKKEYEQIKWILIVAGIVAASLTIYNYQMLLAIKGISERTSIAIDNRAVALNSLPFDLLLSLSLCTASILKYKKIIVKGLFIFFVIAIMYAIILTGSRGGLIAASSVLMIFFINIKNLNRRIAFALVISLAAIIIIPVIPEFMIQRIHDSVESRADGRVDIWIVGLHALQKYWLFGAGLDNFPIAYDEFVHFHYKDYLKPGRGPHNTYVGFLVELGIIGLFLLTIALIKHYKAISGTDDSGADLITLKAAFCGMMIYGLTGDIVWSKMLWLLFMMIILHKNFDRGRGAVGFAE